MLLQIEKNLLAKTKTCCIFLDLSKAFDMVEHYTLLNTLDSLGFRGHFHTLLKNYLSNRLFSIKNSDHEYQITRGVPQGSILSPILFSLYVNDFNTIHTDTIQYADDTTFVISYNDEEHLFQIIKKIERNLITYLKNKHLIINSEKTEIILFNDNKLKSIQFLNNQINISDQSKFLGIMIHKTRKFNTHIIQKVIPNIRKMYSSLYQISYITDKQTKEMVFNAFIIPHILYALPFIQISNQNIINKMERAYNRAIKILYNLPMSFPTRELQQRTNIPNLPDSCYKISLMHAHRTFYNAVPNIDKYFSHTKRNNFIIDPHQDDKSLHNFLSIIWNNLHTNMKNIKNKETFKTHLNNDN